MAINPFCKFVSVVSLECTQPVLENGLWSRDIIITDDWGEKQRLRFVSNLRERLLMPNEHTLPDEPISGQSNPTLLVEFVNGINWGSPGPDPTSDAQPAFERIIHLNDDFNHEVSILLKAYNPNYLLFPCEKKSDDPVPDGGES